MTLSALTGLMAQQSLVNVTNTVHAMSNNLSYLVRGIGRVQTMPEDRRLDYLFRDFWVTAFFTSSFTEIAQRIANQFFIMPLLFDTLQLEKLGYDKLSDHGPVIKLLHNRIASSLFRKESFSLLPTLLETDLQQLPTEALKQEALTLANHLKPLLHPDNKTVQQAIKTIYNRSFFPKNIPSTIATFIVYGWLVSKFDNNVLQPFEQREYKKHGTLQHLLVPAFLSVIPGLAAYLGIMNSQKFNPLQRIIVGFTVGSGISAALLAYGIRKATQKANIVWEAAQKKQQLEEQKIAQLGFQTALSQLRFNSQV